MQSDNLEYNDEIESIEYFGDLETIDISVSGDHLFFCNDILVKNSWGIPQTADFMFCLVGGETFEKLRQRMVKQLKNRYGDEFVNRKFCVGIDKPHMRFYNVEQAANDGLSDANPSEQDEKIAISKQHGSQAYTPGYTIRKFGKDKNKFSDIKVE